MFSSFRTNPFPVRAAIQVGCDNCISGTVGRVDVTGGGRRNSTRTSSSSPTRMRAALRDQLLNTEVAINAPRVRPHTTILDDETIAEATNALRKVTSSLGSQKPTELAIMLMPPFDRVSNAKIISELWAREFKAKVHFFDKVSFGGEMIASSPSSSSSSASTNDLVRRVAPDCDMPVEEKFELCWFFAHAAAAKHLVPERLLVIKEQLHDHAGDQQQSLQAGVVQPPVIDVIGFQAHPQQEQQQWDDASSATAVGGVGAKLLKWRVPLTSASCHRLLYEQVQRRPMAVYAGPTHSVNPVHRNEVLQLCDVLKSEFRGKASSSSSSSSQEEAESEVPEWIIRRIEAGAVVCGSSFSVGSTLDVCSRVAGSVMINLEKLEQVNQFHYAGLSDAMLHHFPTPSLVVPQACLLSALCRQMHCRRVHYLPEVGVAHAMLVNPDMWFHGSSSAAAALAEDRAVRPRQSEFAYPQQAVDRFQPHRLR